MVEVLLVSVLTFKLSNFKTDTGQLFTPKSWLSFIYVDRGKLVSGREEFCSLIEPITLGHLALRGSPNNRHGRAENMRTLKRNTRLAKLLRIIIFDTTLRDGEQCPGASMNLREKLEVARQLKRLGVDVIEAGFPVISKGDFDAVKAIATKVHGPVICALARCRLDDIKAAGEAIKPAGKRGRIHVFLASSKMHRKYKLKKTPDQILTLAMDGVRQACKYGVQVEFSPEDASRTEYEFLLRLCRGVVKAGATILNIPDTVGWGVPEEYGRLIARLCADIPEVQSGTVTISAHCHNDQGLATANAMAAIKAGARQVECTVNGIGERAGNSALEEIIAGLIARPDYYGGIWTGVNSREILKTSRLVARMSGLEVQRSKAVVGENAFAHASGIHSDGVLKKRETYEILDPRAFGWKRNNFPLTKHSGRAAVMRRLKQLGLEVSETVLRELFARFKEIGDKKKFVYDDDLTALVEGHITEVPETWSLEYFNVTGGTGNPPTATVRLKNCQDTHTDACIGDGPVDAVIKAIDRVVGTHGGLLNYSVRSVSPGQDTIGEVTLEVDFGDGKRIKGRNAATDVIEASARAYLNAVNRHLMNGGGKKGK